MTGTGKIARLPREIREQLNRRIDDGEPGTRLVEWLNSLPEARSILAAEFDGRDITEQNLSEWKARGYRDWIAYREARELLHSVADDTAEVLEEFDHADLTETLAAWVAARAFAAFRRLLEADLSPEDEWRRLQEFSRELAVLRRQGLKAGRLAIDRERWDMDKEQRKEENEKREIKAEKDRICAPVWAKMQLGPLADYFGGTELDRKIAAQVLEIQNDLPKGILTGEYRRSQAESNPVKAGQNESK